MVSQFLDGSAFNDNATRIENWDKIYDYLGQEFATSTKLSCISTEDSSEYNEDCLVDVSVKLGLSIVFYNEILGSDQINSNSTYFDISCLIIIDSVLTHLPAL